MAQKKFFFIAVFISALVGAPFATYRATINHIKKQTSNKQKKVWITIFVHGSLTHLVKRFSIKRLSSMMKDKVEGTLYEEATKIIRDDTFFRKNQPIQGLGLQKIDMDIRPGRPEAALARTMNALDSWFHQKPGRFNRYYTYGWHGLISKKLRYKAAEKFYAELAQEIQKFEAQGIKVHTTIVGYSHGGNIALLLGDVHSAKNHHKADDFPYKIAAIDQIVLLGIPLHKGIDYKINSPLFKKVYNIYSCADRVQCLDIFAEGSLFSRQTFVARKDFQLPDKLKQIRLRVVRNRATKKNWEKSKDPRRNFKKKSIISGKSPLLRNASPSHLELWFFGWTRRGYRQDYPFKPIPMIAMLPVILDAAQRYEKHKSDHLIIDLRPDQMAMIIKSNGIHTVTQLLPEQLFESIKTLAYRFAVEPNTKQAYEERVSAAIRQAIKKRKEAKLQ
jgi:hypothetical protein